MRLLAAVVVGLVLAASAGGLPCGHAWAQQGQATQEQPAKVAEQGYPIAVLSVMPVVRFPAITGL